MIKLAETVELTAADKEKVMRENACVMQIG